MKKLLFIIFIAAAVNSAQVIGPKISAPETKYDFGTVTQGEMVLHDYIIVNNGDDVLKITRVRASCGCTAAKPEKEELAPGESIKIHVEFNSRGRRGSQRKTIYIYSNDTNAPEFRLKLTGKVEMPVNASSVSEGPLLKLEKNQHNFGKLKEGDVVDVTIRFKNTGSENLLIKDVKSSCGCTAAVLSSRNLKPGEEGELKIEFDSSNRVGSITRTVTLYTNDRKNPVQTITIFANIEK